MLCQSEGRLSKPTSRTDIREHRPAYHTEDSVQCAADPHLNDSICGTFRKIRRKCAPQRHISRNLPNNLPERCPEMVCFTEASERRTAPRPYSGISHGSIRKPCQNGISMRSISRKHLKDVPQRDPTVVCHTDASERYARLGPYSGTSHGSIRTICRKDTLKWSASRNCPKDTPNRHPKTDRFTEASESSTAESTEMARHTETSVHRAIAVSCECGPESLAFRARERGTSRAAGSSCRCVADSRYCRRNTPRAAAPAAPRHRSARVRAPGDAAMRARRRS